MVWLVTEPTTLARTSTIRHDGCGMKARIELIPLHGGVECNMLAEYFVVLLPPRATVALSFSHHQASIGKQIPCLGICSQDSYVCQET